MYVCKYLKMIQDWLKKHADSHVTFCQNQSTETSS